MSDERLRVWVVTPELHRRGGTERCLAEQVERWKDDFDVTVYCMETDGVDLSGARVRHVLRVPGPHLLRWCIWFVANTVARRRDARKFGPPDVVYAPGINCLDADAITVHIVFKKHWDYVRAGTVRDLKRPGTFLRTAHRWLYWKILHRLEERVYSGPAGLAALSRWDAEYLEETFGRRPGSVRVIPHGVDPVAFSPEAVAEKRADGRARWGFADDTFVAMLFGNDLYKKGIDTMVRALTELPDRVILAIRGDLDTRPVEALASKLGVGHRVVILPRVQDALLHFAAADLIVQPSREDSFSMPPLEGMACGLPVIVSDKLGFAELLTDHRDARVLTDADDAHALASLVRAVVDGGPEIDAMIADGLLTARSLSWEGNARLTADMIREHRRTR